MRNARKIVRTLMSIFFLSQAVGMGTCAYHCTIGGSIFCSILFWTLTLLFGVGSALFYKNRNY
jgi:hypothetical protein